MNTEITRVEIIEEEGRVFTRISDEPLSIQVSLQDQGRTLKIFLESL